MARTRTPGATRLPLDVVRGGLIGTAEVVPGISGGTVALVVGVYETLIGSAGHLVRGLRLLAARRREEARAELDRVRWGVVLPVMAGMAVAVVVAAAVLEPVLRDHPVQARAVLFGLVLASIAVPFRMVGDWNRRLAALAGLGVVTAAVLTGLPPGTVVEPALPVVALAAAVAVCALVLPGVSGSFFLLSVGLYEGTLGAVNERDLVYLGVFLVGCVVGLALFVPVLQYLLETHHAVTLAAMTGLMTGSLRALWPWQTEDRGLLAPSGDVLATIALALAGAAVVTAMLVAERRLHARHDPGGPADHAA